MNDEIEHLDALGNKIVLGKWYGYSRSESGWAHVTIGIASSCKNGKVHLHVKSVKRYLYGDESDFRKDEPLNNVSIRSNMVFPVAVLC